jgi:hypothetical protein
VADILVLWAWWVAVEQSRDVCHESWQAWQALRGTRLVMAGTGLHVRPDCAGGWDPPGWMAVAGEVIISRVLEAGVAGVPMAWRPSGRVVLPLTMLPSLDGVCSKEGALLGAAAAAAATSADISVFGVPGALLLLPGAAASWGSRGTCQAMRRSAGRQCGRRRVSAACTWRQHVVRAQVHTQHTPDFVNEHWSLQLQHSATSQPTVLCAACSMPQTHHHMLSQHTTRPPPHDKPARHRLPPTGARPCLLVLPVRLLRLVVLALLALAQVAAAHAQMEALAVLLQAVALAAVAPLLVLGLAGLAASHRHLRQRRHTAGSAAMMHRGDRVQALPQASHRPRPCVERPCCVDGPPPGQQSVSYALAGAVAVTSPDKGATRPLSSHAIHIPTPTPPTLLVKASGSLLMIWLRRSSTSSAHSTLLEQERQAQVPPQYMPAAKHSQ